ncbi:putative ABC transport system permease protein [Carnobacterium alterfunditum]|uniref:Putative ABC transport system permease protein n=1 Tax=Carnobacterium alterfunditum TaxID=28230 RepID=A0A1N6EJK9_9LACT|nr:iron export ABC transporter permease subunit FetB [Carnobacterium alterfunditum]SIN83157.1 putative ABC transport system permease protein [Carnobacterium alterfunditum]
MNLAINNTSLFFATALVGIALLIVYKEKLGLGKDILISVFRAVIQLFAVGYLLGYVFELNNVIVTLALVLVIIFNASFNAGKRSKGISNAFKISFIAIFTATGLTLLVLILSGSVLFIPSQVIPITGMIASNSMIAIGIAYRNLNAKFTDQRQQVLEKLALGADLKQASVSIVRDSIRAGMSPTIDSAKTIGIVSLPGMMSGLMFAGVDPTRAIKYQIMVTFMLLSTTSIASVIASYMAYKEFYNDRKQLKN